MLYLVPTPIGNLEDITVRALDVLKTVDYILAEDTRKTSILLRHYDIDARTTSYHQHNEKKKLQAVLSHLKEGKKVALVSEAGMPGISDPGFLLVRACIEEDIVVSSLPGPNALTSALVASGLPSDHFYFAGFLPHKKGRNKKWEDLASREETMIVYESPYRIDKFLMECEKYTGPDRLICIAREMTKIHEEYIRGTVSEIRSSLEDRDPLKGEMVVVIAGKGYSPARES
ncbi:MAG TPA: 16S rRNA (cytidine(1402)-2'-O)-methyltransferase [Membranihabitans sp.]|nr:16S rRNA (cytidine(1402)-2'-O)-methyltransferase [Membranihabitans sp.]